MNDHAIPSREEDARLARAAQAGDREARDRLVCGHWKFVVWIAKRYRHCGIALADLVNEGVLGLMRAIELFEPERGVRFCTYAAYWIRQAVLRAIADQSRVLSLDAAERPCADRHGPSPTDAAHDSMMAEGIEAALHRLPPREAEILRLRFGLGDGHEHTLEEVSRLFRITRERVRQIQLKAMARLRLPGRLPTA